MSRGNHEARTICQIALVFWPMTASRRRLPTFVAALVALELSGHAVLLYATTGRVAHSGASGLFCCPSTPTGGGGLVATLTANAGWLLLLVQLLVVAGLISWAGIRNDEGDYSRVSAKAAAECHDRATPPPVY